MLGNEYFSEILMVAAYWICIVAALTGIALGLGLNFSKERTLRLMKASNRWVSMRKKIEPLERPRDSEKAIFKRRKPAAVFFILGGAYTIYMLLFVIEFPHLIVLLSENANPLVVAILVESLKWLLVASGSLAVVVGIAMLVSENALPSLRARLDRWHSTEKIEKPASQMHMVLDNLTETYPRLTGIVLIALSGCALVTAAIVRNLI